MLPQGFRFCFATLPFSPSPNLSQIFSPSLLAPPLPKDLFMEAESLNPGRLYSSEAVRWQLLMSMLMTLPQPGEHSQHLRTCQLTEAKVPTVLNSHFGEVRWGEGFGGLCYQKRSVFFFFSQNEGLHECIHGKQR